MLDALNVPANGIPTADTDPRIQVMLDPNPDGEYISYDVTKTNSEISDIATEKGKDYQKRKLYPANYYCVLDSQAVAGWKEYEGNSNVFGLWMGAAEVSLSKSEAYLMGYGVTKDEAKAKECFIKGIELSTEYFWNEKKNSSLYKKGNDSYNANRDLIEPTAEEIAAYAEKAWKPTQEAVCTQLWLNFGWTNLLEGVNKTGAKELYFPQLALSLSVAWNDATSTLTMAGGTPMGPFVMGKTTYYLFADMTATDGYVYWDNSVTYSATIAYDEDSKATTGEFKDDGTIDASTQVNGVSIDAFKDNEASNDNYAGGLLSFGNHAGTPGYHRR